MNKFNVPRRMQIIIASLPSKAYQTSLAFTAHANRFNGKCLPWDPSPLQRSYTNSYAEKRGTYFMYGAGTCSEAT